MECVEFTIDCRTTLLTKSSFVISLFNDCDGIWLSTPECYEPETAQQMREWSRSKRQVVVAGPFIPTVAHASSSESSQSPKSAEILSFLDRVLDSHGERAVLYVRLRVH